MISQVPINLEYQCTNAGQFQTMSDQLLPISEDPAKAINVKSLNINLNNMKPKLISNQIKNLVEVLKKFKNISNLNLDFGYNSIGAEGMKHFSEGIRELTNISNAELAILHEALSKAIKTYTNIIQKAQLFADEMGIVRANTIEQINIRILLLKLQM